MLAATPVDELLMKSPLQSDGTFGETLQAIGYIKANYTSRQKKEVNNFNPSDLFK